MAARHFVADGDFALLCNINADKFMNAGGEFVLVFAAENANVNNNAALAVRNTQGGVANLARLFAENCPEQAFLGGELRLALGRDFADKDVAGMNLRTDSDDAAFVKILQCLFADVGDIARDLFRTELLCVACLGFVFFDME